MRTDACPFENPVLVSSLRFLSRAWAVGLTLGLLSLASPVSAQPDDIEELVAALRNSDDFRVRTQAALALGVSGEARAVEPLCDGLGDGNTTVRAASASALGRLRKGGAECLSAGLEAESNEDVKGVIQRALDRVRGDSGPAVDASTRYYVAIGKIANKTNRSDSEIASEVRKQLTKHLRQASGFAVAPPNETEAQANAVMKEFPQLKSLLLWPKLEVTYAGTTLKLRLELSLLSYPGKSFLGSMSRKLAMPDTPAGDTASENELMEMAAEQLVPELARAASKL